MRTKFDGVELVRMRSLLRACRLNATELRRIAEEAPLGAKGRLVAFSHLLWMGGIIAVLLFTHGQLGESFHVPFWVVITCAITMAAGTAAGGWRIIRTMGHKMVKLQPVHGFAAETTAALIIHYASVLGIPLSTTHAISTSIMGVGAVKRFGAVKWTVVERILWAWVFTLPVCGLIGYFTERLCVALGYK